MVDKSLIKRAEKPELMVDKWLIKHTEKPELMVDNWLISYLQEQTADSSIERRDEYMSRTTLCVNKVR